MKTILNDIRDGNLKQVYLLYGDEAYLKFQFRDKLLKAMVTDGDTMNFASFDGKGVDVRELISIADTLPFFADYRTVLITDSGFFKSSNEELCDYLKNNLPDTTRVIFVEKEVDKRNRLYKIVKDIGKAVEFAEQDEATLRKWIAGLAAKEEKVMNPNVISYFLEKTGTDMSNIKSELEKLFCYCLSKDEISKEDVDSIVTERISNHIFDMITAIALKQQKRALTLYYELLALKEPPMRILFLISKQFNSLLQVKDLRSKGYDKAGITKKMALHPFVAEKYLQQASKFKQNFLKRALTECVETDEAVKTGKMTDRLGVELLIVKYSSEQSE